MNHFVLIFSITTLVSVLIYFVVLACSYRNKYKQQSARMIQLYLNKQFLGRLLRIAAAKNDVYEDKILDIMSDIKEYFQLDDILLYKSRVDRGSELPMPGVYKQSLITQYVDANIEGIEHSIKMSGISVKEIDEKKLQAILYIVPAHFVDGIKYIIFVHSAEGQLNMNDIEILCNPIRIILSGMLSRKMFY